MMLPPDLESLKKICRDPDTVEAARCIMVHAANQTKSSRRRHAAAQAWESTGQK